MCIASYDDKDDFSFEFGRKIIAFNERNMNGRESERQKRLGMDGSISGRKLMYKRVCNVLNETTRGKENSTVYQSSRVPYVYRVSFRFIIQLLPFPRERRC